MRSFARHSGPWLGLLLTACLQLSPHASPPFQKGAARDARPKRAAEGGTPKSKAAAAKADKTAASKSEAAAPRLVVQLGHSAFREGFAAFSHDGRLLATGSAEDQTVVVWDVATGREVRRLEGNAPPDDGADYTWMAGAFSRDGRLLAVGLGPHLRVWDIRAAKILRLIKHEEFLFAPLDEARAPVAFSQDGRRLLTNGVRSRMTFDAATGRLLSRASMSKAGPDSDASGSDEVALAKSLLSPDGRLRMTFGGGAVNVTDKATGAAVGRVQLGGEDESNTLREWSPALSPDNRTLAVVVSTGYMSPPEAALWDLKTGTRLRQLEGRPEDRSRFVFTKSGGIVNAAQPPDAEGGFVRLREMVAAREWGWSAGEGASDLQVSSDGRFAILTRGASGEVYDAETGARLATVKGEVEPGASEASFGWDFAAFTPDETFTFYKQKTPSGRPQLVRLGTHDWKVRDDAPALEAIPKDVYEHFAPLALTPDTKTAAWETRRPVEGRREDDQLVTVWRASEPGAPKTFKVDADEAFNSPSQLALSPDGARVLVATANPDLFTPQAVVKVYDAREGRALFQLRSPGKRITDVAWSPDGRTLATVSNDAGDPALKLWDAGTGALLHRAKGVSEGVSDVRFSPDGRLLLAHDPKGFTYLFDAGTGAEVCRMLSRDSGDWVVVDPRGRFDTNNLGELRGVHWLAPEDPLRPLPLEIFMRDYYEPRLLARLLAGERFAPVRSLSEVDRAQPSVRIASVEQRKERPELARVTVEVSRPAPGTSGVQDLRLFRDGQLVAYAPAEGGEVKTDAATGKATLTFDDIRLPRPPFKNNVANDKADGEEDAGGRAVEFTAYAFNEDRVKSETARASFVPPSALKPSKGRAYVLTVGVNAYENEAWDLRFAANDARRLQQTLSARLAAGGEYEEVLSVPLVSDYAAEGGRKARPRVVKESSATKANFRTVIDLLAGRKVDEEAVRGIPNASSLRRATPEDLVVISFSSHGYADERGNFFLFPYDTGAATELREAAARAISSDELSLWLRDVDAGELVLVVDACHSAASVEGEGFKPGPMGSRGLGQLSYDKGMRILASTQAEDIALESVFVEQGLLTYALTRDGLESARADFRPRDARITVSEWLAYGVDRVPALHADVEQRLAEMRAKGRAGEGARGVGGDEQARVVMPGGAGLAEGARGIKVSGQPTRSQQPALFDFSRRRREAVLSAAR